MRLHTHILGGHPQEGSKMAFLCRGSASPGLNEDDSVVMAVATTRADKHGGT
jgi:hypothetical protein